MTFSQRMLSFVRQNAIALLALVIATGTGTAYAAAQIPNGSVTTKKLAKNAVTTPKIKKNAVTGAKIKNRSIGAQDIKVGVLPDDRFEVSWMRGGQDASAAPQHVVSMGDFTLPRAGIATIRLYGGDVGLTCQGGTQGYAALQVSPTLGSASGQPVPLTYKRVEPVSQPRSTQLFVGSLPLPAGQHYVGLAFQCPGSNWNSVQYVDIVVEVSLAD